MTTRTLLLCCGLLATIAAIQTPSASASTTIATTALAIPNADPTPVAFPGSVRELSELIVEAGEVLRFKGPLEFRVGGEVRIEGEILVDGVEISGRPNLTIKALGPITLADGGTLRTTNQGHGAHGGSIRLHSAEAISLRGTLAPSAGNDGRAPGQHGGHGGSIELEAPVIRTSQARIESTNGGDGGPGANGGNGGSVLVRGAFMRFPENIASPPTVIAGNAGHGGDGVSSLSGDSLVGGNGGKGGDALIESWRVADWLDELGIVNDHRKAINQSAWRMNGENGEPGQNGSDGAPGANAISGDGGNGGDGADAAVNQLTNTLVPSTNAGNGGDGGRAVAGSGGSGGSGGMTGIRNDLPLYGEPGGIGGNGGLGGTARAGNGGDGGQGGKPLDPEDWPALKWHGHNGHHGNPGHGGIASGGSGGHGGDGGHSAKEPGAAGDGGSAGDALGGMGGSSPRNEGQVNPRRGLPGHEGRQGHAGRQQDITPKDNE